LASEIERSKGEISIWGAEVPVRGLAVWGIGSILLVQIYLLLLINRLFLGLGLDKDALGLPWFALFPSCLPRLSFAASISILPAASVVLLLLATSSKLKSFGVLGLVLSTIVAGLSVYSYQKGLRLGSTQKAPNGA